MAKKVAYLKAILNVVKDDVKALFLVKQARQRYEGIKQYHPKIVKELNVLFDLNLPAQEPHFSTKSYQERGVVHYGPRQKDHVFMKHPQEYDVHTHCEEEAHRYHWFVNTLFKYSEDPLEDLIMEAVAEFACVRVLPKLGFDKIAKAIERWAQNAYIEDYSGQWTGPSLDDVVKLLLERDEPFFREFVRSEPKGLLGKLHPGWAGIKELDAYAIPPIGRYLE